MFPIEQSGFLHALGRAIGNSLWQVAALWLLFKFLTGVFKLNASRKYQLATGASMVGFIWFAGTFLYYSFMVPVQVYSPVYSFAEANETISQSSFVNQLLYLYHSVVASSRSLSPYISCAYLLVFLLLSVRLVNGFKEVKFFATQGVGKVDIEWRLFVQRHSELLRISRNVKVFTSQYVESPLTMGFWKPIILLPVTSLNNLTTQQVEAILLHELAHIKRHDYLVNIFVQVAEICLFFNPFMRLLLKQVKQERENCCDDYVLQFQYSAKDYAKALLSIQKNNAATLLSLSASNNTQSFQLLNRVKRMVAPQPHAFNYRQQLSLLMLITILGLSFTIIVPRPKIKVPEKQNTAATTKIATETKQIVTTNTAPAPPKAPAAFDLVKTIQGIQQFAANIDTEALEANAKIIEAESEAFEAKAEEWGRNYGEQIERKLRPLTENVSLWSDTELSEQQKASVFAKQIENLNINTDIKGLGDLNKIIAPAMQQVNIILKALPAEISRTIHINTNSETTTGSSVRVVRSKSDNWSTEKEQMAAEAKAINEQISKAAEVKATLASKKQQTIILLKEAAEEARIKANKNRQFQFNAAQKSEHVYAYAANGQEICVAGIPDPKINFSKIIHETETVNTEVTVDSDADNDNNDFDIDFGNFDMGKLKHLKVTKEKRMSKNGKEKKVIVFSFSDSK